MISLVKHKREVLMITPLTILSLDQGKFYRPDSVPSDDVDLDDIAAQHISRVGATLGRSWLFAFAAVVETLAGKSRFMLKLFEPKRPNVSVPTAVRSEP
jgi:hypothetical protein